MLGKAETSFNVRLNNHQKDVKKSTLMICKHFQQENLQTNCNKHVKFTIIDQLTNTSKCNKKISSSDSLKEKIFGFLN